MSFGDLITLLLFIVFVVAPAFNRQRRAGAPRGGTRPAAPRPTESEAPEAPAEDDLLRRLEAARERVRRAMEAEAGAPRGEGASPPLTAGPASPPAERPLVASPAQPPVATPARPLVTAPPRNPVSTPSRPLVTAPPRPLVSTPPRPLVTAPPRSLGGAPPRAPEAVDRAGDATSPRDLRREAPALTVERRGGGAGGWAFDPKNVREGFIWHHILGRPRAHERLGGTPYRHP